MTMPLPANPAAIQAESASATSADVLIDVIFGGKWRSLTLSVAAALGIFDQLSATESRSVNRLAETLGLDWSLLGRVLRAVGAIGLVEEDGAGHYRLTDLGVLMRSDTVGSMAPAALMEGLPEHPMLWAQVPDMVRDGQQDGFRRRHGQGAFEYMQLPDNPYGAVFHSAMSSFSLMQTRAALEAVNGLDLQRGRTVCDVGGGYGHLLAAFLTRYPQLDGILFEQPAIVAQAERLLIADLAKQGRCVVRSGDMFAEVPEADIYLLKMILHDWSDEECVTILRRIRQRARPGCRVLIIEHVVPEATGYHFSKLFDLMMMCWGSGRERTEREYGVLLGAAGFEATGGHYPADRSLGVIEGRPIAP